MNTIIVYIAVYFAFCLKILNSTPLSFPPDFKFGLATASFQIEGGWNASGEYIFSKFKGKK